VTTTRAQTRYRIEAALAALSGGLGLLTLVWRDWLEAFGWDPDHGNGSVELLVVLVLLAASVALGVRARRHLRLLAAELR
jgi:hypothetical protein